MKTGLKILMAAALGFLAGCNGTVDGIKPLGKGKELLTVDFQEGRTLRYRFVSRREITLNWGAVEGGARRGKDTIDKSSESMDMVVAYTPVKVDPYGLTTIKATCKSVNVKRSPQKGRRGAKDAVRNLAGRTFTFTVRPTGQIEDRSELDKLIKEVGKKAFRADTRRGRIKEPDMIGDFIASQWFLWDSISSIENPIEGVAVGESWKSKLSVPSPMLMREAREVTYTLDEVRATERGKVAVIKSSYSHAESRPTTWPIPYAGSFMMSGRFGLLSRYKILDFKGTGEELFNMETGQTERYNQKYKMRVAASLIFPIPDANPQITVQQELTMRLVGN
ncbi:MAG: DUF6263 family protein [Planctomycetota bacterium]